MNISEQMTNSEEHYFTRIQFSNKQNCTNSSYHHFAHLPSAAEKQYYADLCLKMDISQKILGQSYCVLVLGIGLENNHHMACGQ